VGGRYPEERAGYSHSRVVKSEHGASHLCPRQVWLARTPSTVPEVGAILWHCIVTATARLARIFHKRSVLSWCRTFFPEIQLRRDLLPPLLGYETAFAPLVK
jgi:hypothetical protein